MQDNIPLTKFIEVCQRMADWHRIDEGHAERAALLALRIGERFGLSAEQLENLGHGMRLHDIGRVGVDDDVMSKPSELTQSQRAAVQEHALIGYELVRGILPDDIAFVLKYHHENFDGTGYPDGLIGEVIPVLARVAAIADRWDALRNDRPYRKALNFENSLHIMNMSKSHFDPRMYTIFLALIREGER